MPTIREDHDGYSVAVTVERQGEHWAVTKVEMTQTPGGPQVTGEALRKLALTPFIQAAAAHGGDEAEMARETIADATRDAERLRAAGPTNATLRWVGHVHGAANVLALPPVKTVQQTFGVSYRTASNWVASAREAGLLL